MKLSYRTTTYVNKDQLIVGVEYKIVTLHTYFVEDYEYLRKLASRYYLPGDTIRKESDYIISDSLESSLIWNREILDSSLFEEIL